MTPSVRRGQIFKHRKWLDPEQSDRPLECVVTAVREGTVYYRARYVDGQLGKPACFPVEQWDRWAE